MVACDLETTGRDATTCRIVTASALVVDHNGTVLHAWEWLADPGVDIPEGAAAIHGITTQHAQTHGALASDVVAQVTEVVGAAFTRGVPVVAFNAAYDLTVLACEAQRHGITPVTPLPVVDPYVLHKRVRQYWRGKRTLVALCQAYGIRLDSAHTSAADALAAVELGHRLAQEHPELGVPARELHEHQIHWSRAQADDFQRYLRNVKNDPTVSINGEWPVRRAPLR